MFDGYVRVKWPGLQGTVGMNRADTGMARKLNKWREQVANRARFPSKTGKTLRKYTPAQDRWFEEMIAENRVKKPAMRNAEVVNTFIERFGEARDEAGIWSKLHRTYQRLKRKKRGRKRMSGRALTMCRLPRKRLRVMLPARA